MKTRCTAITASIVVGLLGGCGGGGDSNGGDDSTAGPPWFEAADPRGINFMHESGRDGRYLMPEIMCGGAALFDMDGDGDLDAYLVQAGRVGSDGEDVKRQPNRLFENSGGGLFVDVTAGSGADDRGYGMGVACGDYDEDGRTDLYVTNLGDNVLLRNAGGGRFEDVTARAGVGHNGWGSSVAFVDYDADGDLDLYVCNYLDWSPAIEKPCYNNITGVEDYCSPLSYDRPAHDVLYRNNGDGTFADVSAAAGITTQARTGLGVICGDFTGDGSVEIFVANDGMGDLLWVNSSMDEGGGRFRDRGLELGCAFDQDGRAAAGMGVTAADIDRDGDLDLLVCNLETEPDSFFRNDGGYFANTAAVAGLGGITRKFTRFGMGWHDLDLDGHLDLFQANGRVTTPAEASGDVFAEPNLLWRGSAELRFREVEPRGGTAELIVATSRAAAFGDVDDDGRIDVLVVNRDAPANLLRNIAPGQGGWIMFRVLETSGRDALGAQVRIEAGGVTRSRDVRAAYSYQSSNDPRVHFGLGEATRVDSVTVRWADGVQETFGGFETGRIATIRRGSGQAR